MLFERRVRWALGAALPRGLGNIKVGGRQLSPLIAFSRECSSSESSSSSSRPGAEEKVLPLLPSLQESTTSNTAQAHRGRKEKSRNPRGRTPEQACVVASTPHERPTRAESKGKTKAPSQQPLRHRFRVCPRLVTLRPHLRHTRQRKRRGSKMNQLTKFTRGHLVHHRSRGQTTSHLRQSTDSQKVLYKLSRERPGSQRTG